ncbi:MAG: DNA polymerase IV, partial [Oscillospiraceae bacterium]
PHSTHLMRELEAAALELIAAAWHAPAPIRMLAVTAIHLSPESACFQQLDLLDTAPKNDKQEKLERTMDTIRDRFGKNAIAFGTPSKRQDNPDD